MVNEYLFKEIASNSDDEKKMFRTKRGAKRRAAATSQFFWKTIQSPRLFDPSKFLQFVGRLSPGA